MIKRKTVKSRVPRTRNSGTMTESQYWAMFRSMFRNSSRFWKPMTEAKNLARKAVKGKRHKFEYQCAICKGWFTEKEINVDHIEPCGELKCYEDLGKFAEKLFVTADKLQVLCNKRNDCEPSCHKKKTDAYMKGKKK